MSAETTSTRARAGATTARRPRERIEAVHPAAVLAPLVAAHLAVVAAVALTADRDGWLFSSPRFSLHDWTAAWALGHLWVPASPVSYGLPVLLWPIARAFGGNLPAALPVVVVLQVAILGPVLVLAIYGIAARIAGRVFGYVAALGWVLAPLLALGFFYPGERVFQGVPFHDYRALVHDSVLPAALGLTVSAAYVSMVALVVAAWLVVRSLDTGEWNDVLFAGVVAGFAVGIEPRNALFLPAPILALAVARRRRQAVSFGAALLPAAGTLALWRWTGTGEVDVGGLGFSWEDFRLTRVYFRGSGWSLLLVYWIAIAGAFALVRKAPAKGVLVAAWLAGVFVLNSGSLARGTPLDGSLFRLLEPAYPAFVLMAAGVLLLVPPWGRRRPKATPPTGRPRLTRTLAAAAIVLAVYPLAMVALAGPTPEGRVAFQHARSTSVPVSDAFALRVEDGVLSWQAPAGSLSYRVYRAPGLGCAEGRRDCVLRMAVAATVRGTTWADPEPGDSWYRVAAVSDGRLLLISPPVR